MKRISRRNFLKAMGISATALTLAACGGSSSSTAAGTAGSTAASAVATGEPKAGGTLRLCYSCECFRKEDCQSNCLSCFL